MERTPFHKLFGFAWIDFFDNTPVAVEVEINLALSRQVLDVAIVPGENPPVRLMPYGMEDLAIQNLIIFKPYRDPLDWAGIRELLSFYIDYRRVLNHPSNAPINPSEFKLFAICACYPHEELHYKLTPLKEGVFELVELGLAFRIIVINQLPQAPENAVLLWFSPKAEDIAYASNTYQFRSLKSRTLWLTLLEQIENDPNLSVRLEEFEIQTLKEMKSRLTTNQRLE